MIRVSLFLPVFKAAFLAEAIQSILNQTFSDFELLIVNDASPEDIRSIVGSFNDDRILYEENAENQGCQDLVSFWNRYLERCRGEFVIIASDDDIYAPDYLQEMISLANMHPESDLFHCRIQYIDRDGNIIQVSQPALNLETQMDFIYQRLVWKRKQTLQEFMFRKSTLMDKGGLISFPLAWASDSATAYMMAEHGVAYSCRILFSSRLSEINISTPSKYAAKKIKAMKCSGQWMHDFLPSVKCNTKEEEFMKKEAIRVFNAERYSSYPLYLQDLNLSDYLKEIKYIIQHHIFSWRAILYFTVKRILH